MRANRKKKNIYTHACFANHKLLLALMKIQADARAPSARAEIHEYLGIKR